MRPIRVGLQHTSGVNINYYMAIVMQSRASTEMN